MRVKSKKTGRFISGFCGICPRPGASQLLSSCRLQEERQTWRDDKEGLSLGPLPPPCSVCARACACACACVYARSCCCFSMARLVGQDWGLCWTDSKRGQWAPPDTFFVALKLRRPSCQMALLFWNRPEALGGPGQGWGGAPCPA